MKVDNAFIMEVFVDILCRRPAHHTPHNFSLIARCVHSMLKLGHPPRGAVLICIVSRAIASLTVPLLSSSAAAHQPLRLLRSASGRMATSPLRPWQVEGVAFLRKCLSGEQPAQQFCSGCGAILADGMGLGKTRQAITYIGELLHQLSEESPDIAAKVLILCPVSLVGNWREEFRKWLGLACPKLVMPRHGQKFAADVAAFAMQQSNAVCMCSYESFRARADLFEKIDLAFVACDEAHKVKNYDTGVSRSLEQLCPRRLLMTGTPVQNDLTELHTLMDLANPGILGTRGEFESKYARHICKARCNKSTPDIEENAAELMVGLQKIISQVVIKRPASLNTGSLPPHTMVNLFVKCSDAQNQMYAESLRQHAIWKKHADGREMMNGSGKKLKELANIVDGHLSTVSVGVRSVCNKDLSHHDIAKHVLTLHMLQALRDTCPTERVLVISNYTSVLNALETQLPLVL